jgi:penicillin-binding protein 1A
MDRMPLYYSMSLGAGETTLLRLTNAYAMLDDGGHWLVPSVIDVVQDRNGRVIYQKGVKDCAACFVEVGPHNDADSASVYRPGGPPNPSTVALPNASYADNAVLYKPTKPDPLVTPEADHEILSMMQGVVQKGTGIAVAAVGKPLAGKTGTTSDWCDAWFVGFSPDLAAGVFVGFDTPRTLGRGEVGGRVAAPIFRDFMAQALKDVPAKPFPGPIAAAPLVASASYGAGRVANRDEGQPIVDQDAPGVRDYVGNTVTDQGDSADRDDPAPPTFDDAPPKRPGYARPRTPGYAAASPSPWAPGYGASSDGTPNYGAPVYPEANYGASEYPAPRIAGAPPAPVYAPRQMRQYLSLPAWTRPGVGTGGLY